MGWKSVRDYYRIGHSVHVTRAGICIGSPYIHDIIVIGLDGKIKKRDDSFINPDLRRYMEEFDAHPDVLARLVAAKDEFTKSIRVFTYEGGEIIEKECEALGWPNVTHDGELMYDNTFSQDRADIVKAALANAQAGASLSEDRVRDIKSDLEAAESRLAEYRRNVTKLKGEATP